MAETYRFPDAFMFMHYKCDACGMTELIWNSRDGVTPFSVHCQCGAPGSTMSHVRWGDDWRNPNYKVPDSDRSRVFVSMPKERALEIAKAQVDSAAGTPYEISEAEREVFIERLGANIYGTGETPMLVTGEEYYNTYAPKFPDGFLCPRRNELGLGAGRIHRLPREDWWESDNTCSFCGGLKPEVALQFLQDGGTVTPTDKNYKMYVQHPDCKSPTGKTYFQHFTEENKHEFIQMLNAGGVKFATPGYFYRLPFFIRAGGDPES